MRWGIVTCLLLAVGLITVIFYNHPSTTNVTAFFRAVPILPEVNGRVAEVFVGYNGRVRRGDPIIRLDSTSQIAALNAARERVAKIDASLVVAQADVAAADGQIQPANGALEQALDELRTKQELPRRNADVVAAREIERLENAVETRRGALASALAAKQSAVTRITTLIPAQKQSAQTALEQARGELDKMTIRAGFDGRVEQFTLRPGDVVNAFARPAGVPIPTDAGRSSLQAGFAQIEAQVMRVGMAAEAVCLSKPFVVIPMAVTSVQSVIAAGQVRGGDTLIDARQVARPGTITVFLEPIHPNGLDGVPPGSSCIANAYTSNHDTLSSPDAGTARRIALHAVDATGVVHALLRRIQALVLPIRALVFSGH